MILTDLVRLFQTGIQFFTSPHYNKGFEATGRHAPPSSVRFFRRTKCSRSQRWHNHSFNRNKVRVADVADEVYAVAPVVPGALHRSPTTRASVD